MVCSGLGRPGTATECDLNNKENNNNNNSSKNKEDNSVVDTLKYAGIGVGSVALLGVIFAMVRWRRNRNRSKMPDFSEIDYGLSNSRSQRT
ncbi:hypothetical protein BGZ65_000759, partial [Modicella reniformis]